MKTPILGGSYVARSTNAACNRMVNMYPELNGEGGKEIGFLTKTPGLRLLTTVGTGAIRGMIVVGDYLYVASGTEFYKVDSSLTATKIADITGTGVVSMAASSYQIFVACNPDSYVYNVNDGTFTNLGILDPDFPGARTVAYSAGYFIYCEPSTQKFWVTNLLDGTITDPLDFSSAEGDPDNVQTIIVDHLELWVFGVNTVEVYYNSGAADFPYERLSGAFNELGCVAPYSPAKLDNGIFWLGGDIRGSGIVYRSNGYTGTRISTHALEWQLANYSTLSDAVGYSYQQDGHLFYVLTFPTADATWVYDVSTATWHERGEWKPSLNRFGRHRGNNSVYFNRLNIVGDYETGKLYSLDIDYYKDDTGISKWLRSWRVMAPSTDSLKGSTHHKLQIDCETGTVADLTLTPEIILRWSDDGGHTWSNELKTSMGKTGEYFSKAVFRRLGSTKKLRDRVYEISGTDEVKVIINGAELGGVELARVL